VLIGPKRRLQVVSEENVLVHFKWGSVRRRKFKTSQDLLFTEKRRMGKRVGGLTTQLHWEWGGDGDKGERGYWVTPAGVAL